MKQLIVRDVIFRTLPSHVVHAFKGPHGMQPVNPWFGESHELLFGLVLNLMWYVHAFTLNGQHSKLSTESAPQDHCQQPSIDISAQSSDPNSQPTNT